MQRFRITQGGYDKIKSELDTFINVERKTVAKAIAEAREKGDLRENDEYSNALDRQKYIEGRITELNERLTNADIVDIKSFKNDVVGFGASVKLLNLGNNKEVKYQIVSEFESDVNNGKIAIKSPLGKALVGKKKNDIIEVNKNEYEIIDIKY